MQKLNQASALVRARAVRAIATNGDGLGISPASNHHREKAVRAYRGMLPRDLECGPLYHANQILQREVITVSASDEAASAWRNPYLLALARYVVLNPLKAGGVKWLES